MKKLFALFVYMVALSCSVNNAGDKPVQYISSLDALLSSMAQAAIDQAAELPYAEVIAQPLPGLITPLDITTHDAKTGSWVGECVGVIDGDSLVVMQNGKQVIIRLYDIDCPEKSQDFGTRAREFVGKFAYRKNVTVIPMDRDRYSRIVAQVEVDKEELAHSEVDRVNLSSALVTAGLAWVYDSYCSAPECAGWRSLQEQARQGKRGLWSRADAIPPWEWRRQARKDPGVIRESSQYHGNVRSRIFHGSLCRHFTCKNCTAVFATRESAIQAGYRPCEKCKP